MGCFPHKSNLQIMDRPSTVAMVTFSLRVGPTKTAQMCYFLCQNLVDFNHIYSIKVEISTPCTNFENYCFPDKIFTNTTPVQNFKDKGITAVWVESTPPRLAPDLKAQDLWG